MEFKAWSESSILLDLITSFVDMQHGVIFNTACKLPAVKQRRKIPPKNSQEFIEYRKKIPALIQNTIKNKGLFCQEGKWYIQYWQCCTKFFYNPDVAGRILNLDTSIIKLFRDLLIDTNSTTKRSDIKIFRPKSERLFFLTVGF